MDTVLIPLFLCIALGAGIYAAAIPQGGPTGGRAWWGWAGAVAALVLASRIADAPWLGDLAELAAVGLVWSHGTDQARAAGRKYLLAVAAGIVLVRFASVAIAAGHDGGTARFAVAALMLGFALKLGLVPVYFWLPAVARACPAITTALIVTMVDVNGFSDLIEIRTTAPWVFEGFSTAWIVLAVASLLGGALLALAQRELKAMLAFSSIEDMGYLLLGLVLGGPQGLAGAWFGILSHAVAKLVLFGSVGAAEWYLGRPVTLDTRGLAVRLPIASAAFMLGAAGFIGIPPTLGFAGHWRLYLAGVQLGGPILIGVMCVASALALLCYARAIHRTWLGPAEVEDTGRTLPTAPAAVLLAFALAPVLFGLMPDRLRVVPAPHAFAALEQGVRAP